MDCNKLAEIYLRTCNKQDDKGFIIETWTEKYLRKINVANNDNVCLKSMKLFTENCSSDNVSNYKEMKELYNNIHIN